VSTVGSHFTTSASYANKQPRPISQARIVGCTSLNACRSPRSRMIKDSVERNLPEIPAKQSKARCTSASRIRDDAFVGLHVWHIRQLILVHALCMLFQKSGLLGWMTTAPPKVRLTISTTMGILIMAMINAWLFDPSKQSNERMRRGMRNLLKQSYYWNLRKEERRRIPM